MGQYYKYAKRAHAHYKRYQPYYNNLAKRLGGAIYQKATSTIDRKRKAGPVTGRAIKRARKNDRDFSRSVKSQNSKGMYPRIVHQPGAGLGFSKTVLAYPAQKSWKVAKRLAYKDVQNYQTKGLIRADLGQQQAACIQGGSVDIDDLKKPGILYPGQALVLYSQSLNTTAAYDSTFARSDVAAGFRYFMDACISTTLLTNQSPSTVVLTLYDVVAKSNDATNPYDDWALGMTKEGGAFAGSTQASVWGAKPTDTLYFNTKWKIIRSHKIELPTGRCHQHKFTFRYNGSLPMISESNVLPLLTAHKGITCNTLAIVHGVPIDNKNQHGPDGSPDATDVTLDQVKISFCNQTKFMMRFASNKPKKYYSAQALPTTGNSWYIQSENTQQVLNTVTSTNTA